ncbi:MAG: ClpXP protease specificity-enhancing factor [Thioalkalivibrio sp.]|nr:MAG: ClpXP protease specificity-enhancing factor [Thioalkalivibrio sp.]
MTSSRPYLLRALLDWISDNGQTAHLLVDATQPGMVIPTQFIQDGKITLNIGPAAVQGLDMGNEWISFSARFAGQPMQVSVPVGAVLAIYARENGQGMMFGSEPGGDAESGESPRESPGEREETDAAAKPRERKGPSLKVVK